VFQDVEKVKRLLREAEFRSFEDARTRAAALIILGICSYRVAAKATGITADAVVHAVKAVEAGRIPGKDGRPPTMNDKVCSQLKQWIDDELKQEKHSTLRAIIDKATEIHQQVCP